MEVKIYKKPSDIFDLDFDKIKNLTDGVNLSVDNLKSAIEKSRKISLNKFIYSIGIRHIGQENAKTLSSFFKSIDQFSNLFKDTHRDEILENLKDLDGIGETQISSIKKFFSNLKKC